MAVIFALFQRIFVYDVAVKQLLGLPRFQNLLLILYITILKQSAQLFSDYLQIGKVVRCLPDKKNKTSARSPALASERIAPKICQGQLQTIYSRVPQTSSNPFTSGGVIASEHR